MLTDGRESAAEPGSEASIPAVLEAPWTEARLFAAIRIRHPLPEWVCLRAVRDSTGWAGSGRTADAVAMSCYPSRGLEIHGFEIKVARSDWLRELQEPGKADPMWQNCDRWWIVAPPGVVDPKELPAGWGLYQAGRGGLRAKVKAGLERRAKALDRGFVASLLRNAVLGYGPDRPEVLRGIHAAAREEARRGAARVKEYDLAAAERRVRELEATVEAAEKASGLSINRWNAEKVGAAVALVAKNGSRDLAADLEGLATHAERVGGNARKGAEEIRRILEGLGREAP